MDGLDHLRVRVLQILPDHLKGVWLGMSRSATLDYVVHVAHSTDPDAVATCVCEDYEWAMTELRLE